MSKQSAFDQQKIAASAYTETSGVLDQLNLPPEVIRFLRKYQRIIWGVIIVVALVVTVVSLYDSYRQHQIEKGAAALDRALEAPADQRPEQLDKVVEEFASYPAALWARLEKAHLLRQEKKFAEAIAELATVNAKISEKSPLKPLVLAELGSLYEQDGKLDQAMDCYLKLGGIKGFEAEGTYHQALIHELHKEDDKALEMYQQYIALTEKEGRSGSDPLKVLVQQRINHLQK